MMEKNKSVMFAIGTEIKRKLVDPHWCFGPCPKNIFDMMTSATLRAVLLVKNAIGENK